LKKMGILQHSAPPAFVDFYRTLQPENWRRRWQITFDLLLQIKNLCEENHLPLLIWMFPLKEQIYEREHGILVDEYGLSETDYDFAQPQQRMAEFCRENQIRFLSPLTRFQEDAAKGGRFHFISDNHFNAAGHALLAEELFNFIIEQRLLKTQ